MYIKPRTLSTQEKWGGEIYLQDGMKIHARKMKSILIPKGVKDDRLTVRPTLQQMIDLNIRHYRGSQYRYIYFLCDKKEKRRLIGECLESLTLPLPKDKDLRWRVKDVESGKWIECGKPPYKTDNERPLLETGYTQMSIFDYLN